MGVGEGRGGKGKSINRARPLPRFGRRRNTGVGVGGRRATLSLPYSSAMPRRALDSSSPALCASWLDERNDDVHVETLPWLGHHERCDSPVLTPRPCAVTDVFQRNPCLGRAASLHRDGPANAIAPEAMDVAKVFFRRVKAQSSLPVCAVPRFGTILHFGEFGFRALLASVVSPAPSRTSCRARRSRGDYIMYVSIPWSPGAMVTFRVLP